MEVIREIYQCLEISNIRNPDPVYSAVVSKSHLLPGLLELDGIDPLVVARVAHVVKVVINTSPSRARGLVQQWQSANIAPVVNVGDMKALEKIGRAHV